MRLSAVRPDRHCCALRAAGSAASFAGFCSIGEQKALLQLRKRRCTRARLWHTTRSEADRRKVSLPGNPWAPARWFALGGFMKIVAIAQASSYAGPFLIKGGPIGHTSLLANVPLAIGLLLLGKWLVEAKLYERKWVLVAVTLASLAGITALNAFSKVSRERVARLGHVPPVSSSQKQRWEAKTGSQKDGSPGLDGQQQSHGRRPLSTLLPRAFASSDVPENGQSPDSK